MVFILSALWWIRIRSLWKLPDERGWLRGKLGLFLMGRAILSKSLIQFSVDEWGCVPSVLFDLRPNYGRNNEDNGDLFQNDMCMHCVQCPWPCNRPLFTLAFNRDSRTLTGRSGSVSCEMLLLSPGSWHTQGFICALQESVFPILGSSVIKSHWPPKSNSLGVLSPFAGSHWEICCGS